MGTCESMSWWPNDDANAFAEGPLLPPSRVLVGDVLWNALSEHRRIRSSDGAKDAKGPSR